MAAVADKQAITDDKDLQIARLTEELKKATYLAEWEKRRRTQLEGDLEMSCRCFDHPHHPLFSFF